MQGINQQSERTAGRRNSSPGSGLEKAGDLPYDPEPAVF